MKKFFILILSILILSFVWAGFGKKIANNIKQNSNNYVAHLYESNEQKVDGEKTGYKKVDSEKTEDLKEPENESSPKDKEKIKELDELYDKGFKIFLGGGYKQTVEIQNDIIEKSPDYYKAYNLKGIAMCFDGQFEEGMKYINKSLDMNPDFGYARFNKALAYELYNQFDQSLMWYDRALEIDQYAWSYYGKSSIYGRRGDVKNTVLNLKKAIELAPEAKEAAKHEEDFNNVRYSKEFSDLIK